MLNLSEAAKKSGQSKGALLTRADCKQPGLSLAITGSTPPSCVAYFPLELSWRRTFLRSCR
jgi:hypothetical protein